MAFNESWNIRPRSNECSKTKESFKDGQAFYTAIFKDDESEDYSRLDFSIKAWDELLTEADKKGLFSFWRTKFEEEAPVQTKEIVEKEGAETMLRRLIDENEEKSENARYILAAMLERKRILKPVDIKEDANSKMLFYEHYKSGEVFIVRDPLLNLRELDEIQEEVSGWLGNNENPPSEKDPSSEENAN
ncbi:MAG: hypothetical protein VX646_04730 [Verrucomicrobiota bacterium]|nr:hypothetical protein [Verrucomicrobiota bacterium]